MPHSPRSARLEFETADDVAAAIRERGGRLTASRRLVLDALFAAEGPVSAEYLAGGLGGRLPAIEVTSVYRALEQLETLGVARHVHVGHGPGLYALVLADEREYLACERCNHVTSVAAGELDPIRLQIRRAFGYEARFTHFPIIGLCPSCARSDVEHSHEHPHTHEHSHGDYVHSHPHVHERGLENEHEHEH